MDYKQDEGGMQTLQGVDFRNRDFFIHVYNQYWYRMFQQAYRKLKEKEIAEEIVQDIFTGIWKDRERIRVGNLEAYLFGSVRNEIIDHIRKNSHREKYREYFLTYQNCEDESTESTIFYNDLVQSVENVIDGFPQKTREIFRFSRVENWSVGKIAVHFGISEKAVEYHLTKVTKTLKTNLKEHLVSLLMCFF